MDRITELEIKLSYLESAHETLNEVVIQQQQQLEQQQQLIEHLQNWIKNYNNSQIDPAFEKPPHY